MREFSRALVENVLENKDKIDSAIQSVSKNWRVSRMTVIDRCILRMAVCEFAFDEGTEPAVIINEAIEIAKKYSSKEAATFINGILDAVKKKEEKEKSSSKGKIND